MNELTLCGARERRGFLDHSVATEPSLVVIANVSAQAGSFLLTVVGTINLSSLLLIRV